MIKQAKLAAMFIFIIMLSGCTHTTDSEVVTTSVSNSGADFEIYADTLQSQLYEGSVFGFQVIAENKGSYTIPTGQFKLYLEGINPHSYSLTPDDFVKENSAELTLSLIHI